MKNKPRIIQLLRRRNNLISKIIIKDSVKKLGRSGYVALPKELIGKYVQIKLELIEEKAPEQIKGRKK